MTAGAAAAAPAPRATVAEAIAAGPLLLEIGRAHV